MTRKRIRYNDRAEEGERRHCDGDRLVGLVRLLDDSEYIEIVPEESKNAAFYQRFGFKIMEDGVPMQLCSFANKK